MPTHPDTPLSVTWDQVAAFRLARHHLWQRTASQDLGAVVRDMAGAQAQLLSAAQISLWSRVRGLEIAQVEAALESRALVKAACMRRTLFLVPARELAVFVRGTARRAEKEIRWTLGKGVPARVIEAAIEATLDSLDRPLTRPEIAERVSRKLGVRTRAVHGGGWGSRRKVAAVPVGHLIFPVVDLLHLTAARGVVCYAASRGSEPAFVRADVWLPDWQDISSEQAEEDLLGLYMKAFAPATAQDFAVWTGMSLREARQVWARRQADLVPVEVEGWRAEVLRVDLDELGRARLEDPPVRLLPFFDSYLLGHKERDHIVPARRRGLVYRAQGWIAPVVLAGGHAAAVWEHARQGDRLQIRVTKLGPLARRLAAGIREEARDLARFLEATEVDIAI